MWAYQNSKAQSRKSLPTRYSGVLLPTNTRLFPVDRTHKNWHKEIRVLHMHPTPDLVSIRFRWNILTLVNSINRQKKMCIWTALISQTKAKSIQFNTKFQMYTKTADFKFTQYIFNTNICAQTANFIGDISNFLNITEYRCAYMRITEVIFFC